MSDCVTPKRVTSRPHQRPRFQTVFCLADFYPSYVPQKGARNAETAPRKSGGIAEMMAAARLGISVLTGRWGQHHEERRQW